MAYTVSELAKISGISSRTLRYYDQIGLLKPAEVNKSGYRIYKQKELDLLQQILFYREMDMRLEDIKKIIHDPNFDQLSALKHHHQLLQEKQSRLDQLIATVEKTITHLEEDIIMQDEEKFTGFKEKIIKDNEEQYGKEIREKYGADTIDASNAKLRDMSQEEFQKMKTIEDELFTLLEKAVKTADPTSPEAEALVEKHKAWLMFSWNTYSKEAHAGLAEMYVADERFVAYYDQKVKDGAQFLRDAIVQHTIYS